MDTPMAAPTTLLEAVKYFADKDVALQFVADLKWPDGVECPKCASKSVAFLKTRRIWKCRECAKQFSAKVGTIFEDSAIGLDKWLPAMWMVCNCKNGVSSYELARALGVTQKSAWFMLHRLRLAMQSEHGGKLAGFGGPKFSGEVEVDETFIGGKARNMHADKRARIGRKGTKGHYGKQAVMGLLARHGKDGHSEVRLVPVANVRRMSVMGKIRTNVKEGSFVYSDALPSYNDARYGYIHHVIDHAEAYVDGNVHTNGLENFWSLLKRTIAGTYVAVEPFHLFRYLDEQAFRFNNRKASDLARFVLALRSIVGRRLTFDELTAATI